MLGRFLLCLALLTLIVARAGAAEPAGIAAAKVGFDGVYKLGAWAPVIATLTGAAELQAPRLEVIAPDGDGSPAVVSVDVDHAAGEKVRTLVRVGRRDAVIRLRLLDGERLVDQWRSGQDLDAPVRGIAAAEPLIVEAGRATPIDDLPLNWLAYEGVDALVISGAAPESLSDLTAEQTLAIKQWVQSGGHLVLGGGEHAEALVGADGPLRSFAPGEFRETVRVSNTGVIEDYAGSEEAIDAPFGGLAAGRLADVRGVVELYAGGRASEMPLVIRSVYGFGRVTFVAFDLYDPSISAWRDAARLRSLVLQLETPEEQQDSGGGPIVASAYDDLSGALHVKLGGSFAGVQSVSILALVAAVAIYVALLGPGAYFLGKRVTKQMTTAWVSFPVIALGVAGGAAWWGEASTGDAVRLNRLELVDVDCPTGLERGQAWAQLFSPDADLYDLACVPRGDAGRADGYLSWFGLPGRGLGGMQTPAGSLLAGDARYHTRPSLDGLTGVPINRRASKALTARWLTPGRPTVTLDLAATGTGLVEGVVTNQTELRLSDVKLVTGNWAWRLPDLAPGDSALIDAGLKPARLRTLVLNDFGDAQQVGRRLTVDRLSVPAIAYLLMFYDALGGDDFSPLPLRRQGGADLSHALAAGRPILVAQAEQPRSEIRQEVAPLEQPTQPPGAYYRFIGPPLNEPQP